MTEPPVISYPPELPVSQRHDEIARAIRDHQVVVIAGETGSGKTTQLPKICLELGRRAIAHTQPRRIAARTIAERVAEELGSELGELVGYQVRFTDETSAHTRIRLMTDGILLNAIQGDRELRRYDTIIIDEAHERSLNIDFLLGYLKRLLPRRPELKVIITSATIDPESFSRHFGGAPIIEVSGRTFPVEIRYRPLTREEGDENAPPRPERDLFEGILDALDELEREEPGDVLVFLPGEQEIRDAQEAIAAHLRRGRHPQATEVLPLYGRLSSAEQHRVFERRRPAGVRRRVVLATNVAETSLTVPGIAYVIDSGEARISRYSTRAKVQRLPVEPISQASAKQRSGRSGRTRAGIAIRLYSEDDFRARPEFTDPEILRTNLASVLLQMLHLRLGEMNEFPFLHPPDPRGVRDGIELLRELGAVRDGERDGAQQGGKQDRLRLTKTGRALARLPIDPRYGRMVIEAGRLGVAREVLAIVAGLSVQDVRERPLDRRARADQLHARFRDPSSDFLTLLNLWEYLQRQSGRLGSSAFRRLCREEHLNFIRFREWQDVHRQLRQLVRPLGIDARPPRPAPEETSSAAAARDTRVKRGTDVAHEANVTRDAEAKRSPKLARDTRTKHGPSATHDAGATGDAGAIADADATGDGYRAPRGHANGDAVHRAVLSGLLSRLGVYDRGKRDYLGARGTRFSIFPGSALAKSTPEAVMAAELVETSRLYARAAASISPEWAEALAGPLVKRQFSDPHWERKQGQAIAIEQATLYGVPIVRGRRVGLAGHDPAWARDLFIRHALVEGDWTARHAFHRRNEQLRRELERIEERTRRRGLVADEETVFAFYDERLPREVTSQATFERWWREAGEREPELLRMHREDLIDPRDAAGDDAAFPASWRQGDQRLKLRYRFDPGAQDDGVTALVPLPLLARLEPDDFEWQVPGFREELVTALLRSLPKAIRRNFVPAAEWAARLLADIGEVHPELGESSPGPLCERLREHMQRAAGIRFDASEFAWERVPAHLRVRFRVLDERGRVLAEDEELRALQERLKRASEASLSRAASAASQRPGQASGKKNGNGSRGSGSVGSGNGIGSGGNGSGMAGTDAPGESAGSFEQRELNGWPLDEIPAFLDIPRSGGVIRAYPTLRLAKGGRIDLALVTTEAEQAVLHPPATAALLAAGIPSPIGYVQEHLTASEKLSLSHAPYASTSALLHDIVRALAADALARWSAAHDGAMLRAREDFLAVQRQLGAELIEALFAQAKLVAQLLTAHREALAALKAANHLSVLPSLHDARGQLDALVFDGFIARTGTARLAHLPRYLRAVTQRLAKLRDSAALERSGLQQIQQAQALFEEAGGTLPLLPDAPGELTRARWLLEEFRVSLFAQQLGTAETVSLKRIRTALTAQG